MWRIELRQEQGGRDTRLSYTDLPDEMDARTVYEEQRAFCDYVGGGVYVRLIEVPLVEGHGLQIQHYLAMEEPEKRDLTSEELFVFGHTGTRHKWPVSLY